MKKILTLMTTLFVSAVIFAQAPASFNFQAVARDAAGDVIKSKNVSFRISILQTTSSGSTVYQETHTATTSQYGLVNLSIGSGSVVSGTFNNINWGADMYYLNIEMDAAGGSSYTDMGTQQLVSVPYALNAKTADSVINDKVNDADADATNEIQMISKIGSSITLSKNGGSFSVDTSKILIDKDGDTKIRAGNGFDNDKIEFYNNGRITYAFDSTGIKLYNLGNHSFGIGGSRTHRSITSAAHGNTSIGSRSSTEITTGSLNTAIGDGSNGANTTGKGNSSLGYAALNNSIEGSENTSIGAHTLQNGKVLSKNTAIGYYAMWGADSATNNVAIGNSSLESTKGNENTALGVQSLYQNRTGSGNVALGYRAGYNETGSNKLYIANSSANSSNALVYGEFDNRKIRFNAEVDVNGNYILPTTSGSAGQVMVKDNSNVLKWVTTDADATNEIQIISISNDTIYLTEGGFAILPTDTSTLISDADGDTKIVLDQTADDDIIRFYQEGTEYIQMNKGRIEVNNTFENVAIGERSLAKNQPSYTSNEGVSNTAIGAFTLEDNTKGRYNSALGRSALTNNTTGIRNTASGAEASGYNTTGSENTAVGYSALSTNTTGSRNVAIGSSALSNSKSPSENVAIGYLTGSNIKTGNNNVAIGRSAMYSADSGDFNVALGTRSLYNNVGEKNIAMGHRAAYTNTSGSNLIAIGDSAMFNSTTASNNVAIGAKALKSNTTGKENNAIGQNSLKHNTTGYRNDAFGSLSLENNTTGAGNLAIGYSSLNRNKTGYQNIAIGGLAMSLSDSGGNNVAIGIGTLNSSSGFKNIAMGLRAAYTNTSGSNLIAFGDSAMFNSTTVSNNVAIGAKALKENLTGAFNTALGYEALNKATSGENTAIGTGALKAQTIAERNTALGYRSAESLTTGSYGVYIGVQAGGSITTGGYNTLIGRSAGSNITTGSYNTVLGYTANVGATNTNSIAIGRGASVTASNYARIGNTGMTTIGGQVGWSTLSDGKFKTNVQENVNGLDFIMALRPVTYNLKTDEIAAFLNEDANAEADGGVSQETLDARKAKSEVTQTGFIAQEVEAAADSLGYDFSGVDKPQNDQSHYSLRYAEFTVPLVKATQEQQAIIEQQKKDIAALKAQMAKKDLTVEELKAMMLKQQQMILDLQTQMANLTK